MAIPKVDLVEWYGRAAAVPMGTRALDRVLWQVVPFNKALKPHVIQLSPDEVGVELKTRKLLHNHLGSMHAAAIFTVGEYVQGLLMLSNAGALGAELILTSLTIDYTAKAKGDVVARARMTPEIRATVKEGLARGDNTELQLQSVVSDAVTGKQLAVLRGTWKLRPPRV